MHLRAFETSKLQRLARQGLESIALRKRKTSIAFGGGDVLAEV